MLMQANNPVPAKSSGGPKREGQSKGLPKITKTIKAKGVIKLSPSSYLMDRKLKTEEKLGLTREIYPPKIIELLDIRNSSHHKDSHLSVDQAIFQPFPSEVIFQQFEPHLVYSFPLQLRNLDRVARHIKVTSEESPYFSLNCQKSPGAKVAPGMEITYSIVFTPEEKKDYEHELMCITEREKFIVPVRAIGARALLDFPDDISFSSAPVKHCSTKTILMRNVGDAEAKFTIEAEKPFSVSPSTATLDVNSCMQVDVFYVPREVASHSGELLIHYSTGETVHTKLYGSAKDVNVYLDRSSVIMDDTFFGLSSQRSVLLHNRSDVMVKFQWKAFSKETEEDMQKEKLLVQYEKEEMLSKEAFYQSCEYNPSIRDRVPILTRILDLNKKKYTDEEQFLFFDEALIIDPLEGEIWPNSQVEFSILFHPDAFASFSRIAYCDVVGREARLSLKIKGEGIGPKCVLSFDTLDIQSVFVNSSHAYEVVMKNTGSIDATYSITHPSSLFGPKFTFAPRSGTLQPGCLQAIQISFCSHEIGEFDEEFIFELQGGQHPLLLSVKGTVIGPTFQFNFAYINFGRISCGFTATKKVVLSNTSEIPMTFHLGVREEIKLMSSEGTQQQLFPGSQPESTPPKEFVVAPQDGILPPNFQLSIQVDLTPLAIKEYSTALVLQLRETGGRDFSLPISASTIVPHISTSTPLLDFKRCFLDYSYTQEAELFNNSEFMVQYKVLDQTDQTCLSYSTLTPNGVIRPHSGIRIPLQIKARTTGKVCLLVPVHILYSSEPPVTVEVTCIGEGPVIYVTPDRLNWGEIRVLTAVSKTVLLANHSLIPADFECVLANVRSMFSVYPPSAQLQPKKSLELTVTAFMDDSTRISDKLTIVVSRGTNFTISLRADGVGTTIVSDPPLHPSINLGVNFSCGICEKKFTLTNRGRRTHALLWSTEGFSAGKRKRAEMHRKSQDVRDMKVLRSLSLRPEKDLEVIKRPLFEMSPNKVELEPFQSCTVSLLGYSDRSERVHERMVCCAIIGKNPYKEQIMTVDITALFVSPLLEFTTQEVLFHIQLPPESKLIHHTQLLGVRNVSRLPVRAVFHVHHPFCLVSDDGVALAQMELKLGAFEKSEITLLYDSTYCQDKRSRIEEKFMTITYVQHPRTDKILLKAQVDFPNLVFDKDEIDFGCILNDIEVLKFATMTNNSPLPVQYSWFFLNRPPVIRGVPTGQLDKEADMESESEDSEDALCGNEEKEEEGEEVEEKEDKEEEGSEEMDTSTGPEETQNVKMHVRMSSYSTLVGPEGDLLDVPVDMPSTDSQFVLQDLEPKTSLPAVSHNTKMKVTSKKKRAVPWRLAEDPFMPIPITQVFDILPLHGEIDPGASQPIEFMFFGHKDIVADATALCKIEGGPLYEIRLRGEASQIQYEFSEKVLDLGMVLYHQVHTTQLVLQNRGKVGFDVYVQNPKEVVGRQDSIWQPGEVVVSPTSGRLEALESMTFEVSFLPGTPEIFAKTFELQVAHFEVDVITLTGKAIYPKMTINLPRDIATIASDILTEAKSNISLTRSDADDLQDGEGSTPVSAAQQALEGEVERLLVKSFATENASRLFSGSAKGRPKISVPVFDLDFGYLEYVSIKSHPLTITNAGHTPISFTAGSAALEGSGFSTSMPERVKAFPPGEQLEFSITFDPASIKLEEGEASAVLHLNLIGGPRYSVKLRGMATMPKMEVSSMKLDFGTVLCSQCRIITIRLSNPYYVNCNWKVVPEKFPKKHPKQLHIPLHIRKKMKWTPAPRYFEVKPSSGVLPPGGTKNVWIRFMPSEQRNYSDIIPFSIRKNPDFQLALSLTGSGSEPEIVFSSTMLKFGPVLPFSPGASQEVIVSNPTAYPIEFYSLELDSQYLLEEEIICWLKDYYVVEKYLLLPPFQPTAILPQEVLNAYQAVREPMKVKSAETDSLFPSEVNMVSSRLSAEQQAENQQLKASALDHVGTYESKPAQSGTTRSVNSSASSLNRITEATGFTIPILRTIDGFSVEEALARHVGVDISVQGIVAEKRRGVMMIVYGPPLSGKTTQAKALANSYDAIVLDVDSIVIEAISAACTEAGIKARMVCYQAMEAKAAESTEAAAPPPILVTKKQVVLVRDREKDKEKDKEKDQQQTESVTYLKPPNHFKVDSHMDTPYAVPQGNLVPMILQEDIFVEILTNRFAQPDCLKAVVIDGIESSFSNLSMPLILRAFNNRTHIYFVHLGLELQVIKERQEEIDRQKMLKIREQEERKREAKLLEQKQIYTLLEMDEDEYEALTEEQQEKIDAIRLKYKKAQRLKKKKEELLKQQRKEVEERHREDEKLRKKGKKDKKVQQAKGLPTAIGGSSMLASSGSTMSAAVTGIIQSPTLGSLPATYSLASTTASDSPINLVSNVIMPKHAKIKRKLSSKGTKQTEQDSVLDKAYSNYQLGMEGLKAVLEDWDRQRGISVNRLRELEDLNKLTPSRKTKGSRIKEHEIQIAQQAMLDHEESREGIGVPFIDIDGSQSESDVYEKIVASGLPSYEEILIGLGLGPFGNPIPNPVTLQVCPFPLKREQVKQESDMFFFIATSLDDPNGPLKATTLIDPVALELLEEKKILTGPRQTKRPARPDSETGLKSSFTRKKLATRDRHPPFNCQSYMSELPDSPEMRDDITKLVRFRWSLPPFGDTKIKLHFKSQDLGKFDITFNFEIVGTKRCYQLFCRGICSTPQICWEPKIVFPDMKNSVKGDEIVHKCFVEDDKTYHFGPLHCGKTRERYKEGRYPENMDTLTIKNVSFIDLDVNFYFLQDSCASTFLLDPPEMTLIKGECKMLNIWAYPKSVGKVEDSLVICVKNNPNPIYFKICTYGAEPEIKLDKKIIEFKKVLLHRKQTNILHLLNKTLLPVAWKLGGLDQLGEEFSFSQDCGVVQPLSEYPLGINFRASRPVNYPKKTFKIEVSDVEQIMGLMHVESVQISAESYDVAIDISFPRGTEGGLDFQCIKVWDEVKLMLQIKNKGKYDVGYNIQCENSMSPEGINCAKIFHIHPVSATLSSNDKPQTLSIIFKPDREVEFKNLSIIKIQVIDMHLGDKGEVIANIPIRVRAKAVFSCFTICPVDDVSFGSMIVNSRKQSSFSIQNKGMFEFKYAINKQLTSEQQMQRTVNTVATASKVRIKSRERVLSEKSKHTMRKYDFPLRTEILNGSQRLALGMYTIYPAFGSILPGHSQSITVDCIADRRGINREDLSIEISDLQRDTIPLNYRICAEVLVPGIEITDVASIFEEHRVCKKLGALGQHLFHENYCMGVYGEEERKFVFKNIIVGKTSVARFKITNPNKIQCDVTVMVKGLKSKSGIDHAFEVVEPSSKVTISPHSFIYASVSFQPSAMQTYSASFEVNTEFARVKGLTFELQGEGDLPQITMIHPTLRNSKGLMCMKFQQLSLQHSQTLPLTLENTGTIPSVITLEIISSEEAFQLYPLSSEAKISDAAAGDSVPPMSYILEPGETHESLVCFTPQTVKKYKGELKLRVKDNIFERQHIQLIGVGYNDSIFISNIRGMIDDRHVEMEEIADNRVTELYFGTIAVGETKRITFCLTNLCTNTIRFHWMDAPSLTFMPSMGHIKPNCSKDITAAFTFNAPHSLTSQKVVGKMCRINFSTPFSEVPDWDDSMKSVHWVNVPTSTATTSTTREEAIFTPASLGTSSTSGPSRQMTTPAKKKVVETEKEPIHVVMEDTDTEIVLSVYGVIDYVRYECPVKSITFKETLMYQTRAYTFPLKNVGNTHLEYGWSIWKEDGSALSPPPTQLQLDRRGSVVSEGGEVLPFSVSPTSGFVRPNSEVQITVRFSPLDVMAAAYLLRCHISHLDLSCSPLELPVRGISLMPFCHFELEKSNYLIERVAKGESSLIALGIDQAKTKVLEFAVCGVRLVSTRKFNVVNPTNSNYEFVWSEENTGVLQPFTCLTRRGMVEAGKGYQMMFEYISGSLELVESVWTFSIPSVGLCHTFLLVGQTVEPSVNFDRAYMSFRAPLLLGAPAKETVYLINNETTPYQFTIIEKSLHAEGYTGHLKVEPSEGTVLANSKFPVEIRFSAKHQKEYFFTLKCKIKHKVTLLSMKVKAEGYSIKLGLFHSSPGGTEVEIPVGQLDARVLDLGQVQINEKRLEQLSIFNHSLYGLEYHWIIMHQDKHVDTFSINPEHGDVGPGNKQVCQLVFVPTTKMILKNCQLILEIVNGPKLPITLEGSAVEPPLHFSFTEYNFGPCILYKMTENPIPRSTLVITNTGEKEQTVHCLYESQPHLVVQFKSTVLEPGRKTDAIIEFKPQKVAKHCEVIVFEVNGCFHKVITVKGEGAKMSIELDNPMNKTVNFGVLQMSSMGKICSSKTVKIVNHSPTDLSPTLAFSPSSTVPALQQEGVIAIEPIGDILLRANGGSCNITVTFSPRSRVPRFSEPVKLECFGFSEPLFMLIGSCQGIEISLDSDHIPFGAVVQDSSSSRKMCMMNTGDIGAAFSWETEAFGPEFSISPKEGYISSGKQITTVVDFHPKELMQDIRKSGLKCNVEGLKEPLRLTLSGICIDKVPFKEVLQFSTHVRSKDTKSVSIQNKTHFEITIHPVLDGEYWSGLGTVIIAPNQSCQYELIYHPLEMTSETQKHTGSAFFPYPDGSAVLYHLHGNAEPPKQVALISQEVPSKTPHTELLSVENWLPRPQRFAVRREILKPERVDHTISLDGLEYIDVPAMGRKDYKLHFNSFRECFVMGKVMFKNEKTGEFLFYSFHLRATAPGILSSFDLTTPVRQSVSQFVKIVNPFNLPATMSASCTVPEITIPASFIVGASSSGGCMFEYLPLKVGETVGKLMFHCLELGMYQYELHLTATPGPYERPVHFTACLGSIQQQMCRFTNYAKGRTEYSCKISDGDFFVDKYISVAGSEGSMEVTFEPSVQGDIQMLMQVTSATGGDYIIPLIGHCLLPKPQGPFVIRSGHSISIPFRNIYCYCVPFRFVVDNPSFVLSKSGDTLRPRKTYQITVTYDGKHAEGHRVGKLVVNVVQGKVRSTGLTAAQGEVTWVYYLKGISSHS